MKFQSSIIERGEVSFPPFLAEKIYMREFFKKEGLPKDLERWQNTVDVMLEGVETDGPIFLMVDQGKVKKKKNHRRKGPHIDGYWPTSEDQARRHRGISTHLPTPSGHSSHRGTSHMSGASSWDNATFEHPEDIILASNIPACVGYIGEFEGPVLDGGDCAKIDLSNMKRFLMKKNTIYVGNVTSIHESIPVEEDCERTVVRLNIKDWTMRGHYNAKAS